MIQSIALLAAFLLPPAFAKEPAKYQHENYDSILPLPSKVLHQFSPATWIENIAVRENGDLVLTQLYPSAAVLMVSRPTSLNAKVDSFELSPYVRPYVDGLLGIAEISPNVFVVVGSKFSSPGVQVNGTAETWAINFGRMYRGSPLVKRIAKHPRMAFPNGLASLPHVKDAVLIADSALGLVWRLYVRSGKTEVAVKVPQMAVLPGSPLQIGVNGIKVIDGHLYWSNSYQGKLYRLQIDTYGNPRPGALPELMHNEPGRFIDDFTHDERGLWGTTNSNNTAFYVASNGQSVTIAGAQDSLAVARDTACAFGRTQRDKKYLYVVTANIQDPGHEKGGKIVVIDTGAIKGPTSY
ncbi:hypothetical protein CDD83_2970 [Cordyceps sp. RAO-2017]|nr:hypothetical protein CDD83_2970 [Cordyceps sp. RAO-2017]